MINLKLVVNDTTRYFSKDQIKNIELKYYPAKEHKYTRKNADPNVVRLIEEISEYTFKDDSKREDELWHELEQWTNKADFTLIQTPYTGDDSRYPEDTVLFTYRKNSEIKKDRMLTFRVVGDRNEDQFYLIRILKEKLVDTSRAGEAQLIFDIDTAVSTNIVISLVADFDSDPVADDEISSDWKLELKSSSSGIKMDAFRRLQN